MRPSLRKAFAFCRRHPLGAWCALVLLAALGTAAWPAWRYHQFRGAWRATEEALAQHNFEQARERVARCVELRPRDPAVRLLAAQAARRAGHFNEALEHLRVHRELTGGSSEEATLERALLMAQRGRLHEAQEHLLSCLDVRHPATNSILEALALGCVQVYRQEEAWFWVERLLERDPENVTGRITRGSLNESLLRLDKALEDYRRAVEAQPENEKARLHVADVLLRLKRPGEAAEQYEELRRRRPTRAAVLLGLARSRMDNNEPEQARAVLDELLELHPDDGDALLERGRLAVRLGDDAGAEDWLRRAAEAQPHDYSANVELAHCLQGRHKTSEAKAYRRKAARIEADMRQLEVVYARVLKSQKDPAPRLEAGLICLRNGQDQEALRWMLGALQVGPKHRPTHQALASFFEKHGDRERAEEHRRQAGP